jgi:hypothetical protein
MPEQAHHGGMRKLIASRADPFMDALVLLVCVMLYIVPDAKPDMVDWAVVAFGGSLWFWFGRKRRHGA